MNDILVHSGTIPALRDFKVVLEDKLNALFTMGKHLKEAFNTF